MKSLAFALSLSCLLHPAAYAQESGVPISDSSQDKMIEAPTEIVSPAPTKILPGDTLFVTPNEFGFTMAAALKQKQVPVKVTTIRSKADFFLVSGTQANKQSSAERVTEILSFGIFAGNGRSFEAAVNITNKDGEVIFAESVKKDNPRKASKKIAERLKQEIERNSKAMR